MMNAWQWYLIKAYLLYKYFPSIFFFPGIYRALTFQDNLTHHTRRQGFNNDKKRTPTTGRAWKHFFFYNKEYWRGTNLKTIWFSRSGVSLPPPVSSSPSFSKHTAPTQKHTPPMRDYNFVSPVMVVEPSPPPTQPQASDFITPEIFSFRMFLPRKPGRISTSSAISNFRPEISFSGTLVEANENHILKCDSGNTS